jgi:hypothetical protein
VSVRANVVTRLPRRIALHADGQAEADHIIQLRGVTLVRSFAASFQIQIMSLITPRGSSFSRLPGKEQQHGEQDSRSEIARISVERAHLLLRREAKNTHTAAAAL